MPARMQQSVGEDMAPVRVGAELDLVDGHEIDRDVQRHRLDRGDVIAGTGGRDLLLAGDQRDRVRPAQRHQLVVDLAGQQAQRQTDDTAFAGKHPFQRVMGLAGIGRPQDGGNGSVCKIGHGQGIARRGFCH